MELKDLVAVAWKRRAAVLAVFTLTVALAAVFASLVPKRYESTAVVALTPDVNEGTGLFAADNLSALLGTYAETAKSTITLERAEKALGEPLGADIDTSTEAGTGILRISARSEDPQQAADAARAVATAFSDSIASKRLVDATLVNPPSVATSPVQPRPPLILLVAAALGAFGGLLLAVGMESFRRRIETAADIAEYTTAPVIGRLPRERALVRSTARVIWSLNDVIGLQESYRALRTNLGFLLDGHRRVLEITSPDPAQGKSTVVANLAIAFGQLGVETIVVDADLRRPRQHEIFGLDNTEGLSTAMALGGEPLIQPSDYANVSVLTSGPVPPDPTEMLHIRFGRVLEALSDTNALVLIDTPPLLPVSDAQLMAPHADGVLLVVTSGSQRPATLQSTLDKLNLVDAKLLGLILNTVSREGGGDGGYYGYEVREPAGVAREAVETPRVRAG